MQQLWFVAPAYRRYALAEVCFDQWKQIAAALAPRGIELHVVVVSDDKNLTLARRAGFETVAQNNDWLGRRFNDGIEYACRNGADWVAPIGTDSWISPEYFDPLPEPHQTRHGRMACVVKLDVLAELYVTNLGVGPYLYHRSQLEHCEFRPSEDRIRRRCDTSTWVGVSEGHDIVWDERSISPYQHVGFRGQPHLTKYSRLFAAYGKRQIHRPWQTLAEHYPSDLVERARLALGGKPLPVAA